MIKIIAEAGCNWTSLGEAKSFIYQSKQLGLFATKFQIFNHENIKELPHLENLILYKEDVAELFYYGQDIGQEVFFSVMFPEAVDWCQALSVPMYKIRHKDSKNLDLISKCIKTGKPTFISYHDYEPCFLPFNIYPIYCVPSYPADIEEYKKGFGAGYYRGISDHTKDCELLKFWYDILKKEPIFMDLYFEKHVCLTKDCLESEWSCTFDQLREVLGK